MIINESTKDTNWKKNFNDHYNKGTYSGYTLYVPKNEMKKCNDYLASKGYATSMHLQYSFGRDYVYKGDLYKRIEVRYA